MGIAGKIYTLKQGCNYAHGLITHPQMKIENSIFQCNSKDFWKIKKKKVCLYQTTKKSFKCVVLGIKTQINV
jgi:hypothetical protein